MSLKRSSGALVPRAKRSRVELVTESEPDQAGSSDELGSFDEGLEEEDGEEGLEEGFSDGEEGSFEDMEADDEILSKGGAPQVATQPKGKQKAVEEAVDVQAAGSRQAFGLQVRFAEDYCPSPS